MHFVNDFYYELILRAKILTRLEKHTFSFLWLQGNFEIFNKNSSKYVRTLESDKTDR